MSETDTVYVARRPVSEKPTAPASSPPWNDCNQTARGTIEAVAAFTFEVSDPDVEVLGPDAAVVSLGLRSDRPLLA